MFHLNSRRRLGSCLLILLAPLLGGGSTTAFNMEDRLLAAHNRERAAVGVPPLIWDDALSDSARGWAELLAASGAFRHAPESSVNPEGENLWAGTKNYFSVERMVDAWVREKRFFTAGTFPNNSTTGNVADVGHYTQLIWRNTTRVGCAMSSGAVEDVLVCRYSAAGNYRGQLPL